MLVCSLRVLFGTACVLLALGMVALAVMFGGGSMCLGCIIVMFGCFIVFISSHVTLVGCQLPVAIKLCVPSMVPKTDPMVHFVPRGQVPGDTCDSASRLKELKFLAIVDASRVSQVILEGQ